MKLFHFTAALRSRMLDPYNSATLAIGLFVSGVLLVSVLTHFGSATKGAAMLPTSTTISSKSASGDNTDAGQMQVSAENAADNSGDRSSASDAGHSTGGVPNSSTSISKLPVFTLAASPTQVTIPGAGTATIVVSHTSGTKIWQPTVVSTPGLVAYVESATPTPGGGPILKTAWNVYVSQPNPDSSGEGYITVNEPGSSLRVPVKWSPYPSYYLTKGALVRTEDANTITYTANFSIVPSMVFGNPTISLRVMDTSACINGDQTKSFQYNGAKDLSISCVVARRALYIPGSGYPPPLGSNLVFSVNVAVQNSQGYVTPQPSLQFTSAQSPYDE